MSWILPREAFIRGSWNLDRFLQGGRADVIGLAEVLPEGDVRAGRYESVGAVARAADESMRAPSFWSFLHMLDALNSVLTHVSAWCSSCKCHSVPTKELLQQCNLPVTCPMKGRRCPELACGDLEHFVRAPVCEVRGQQRIYVCSTRPGKPVKGSPNRILR